ncbi:hypothetical protein SH668x_003656 [Planctomicrobium sp. SH668]|uniref:hypothetical protein n=1 Tax=Planctomicrobium sp. SH668 TaxID=3448126 RepID=UPI003F5B0099
MQSRRNLLLSLLIVATMGVGCGGARITPTADRVKLTGSATANGKPLNDVMIRFQPTGAGLPAVTTIKSGKFEIEIVPGDYTYFIQPVEKKEKLLATVPTKYHTATLDRKVTISNGGTQDFKLDD